MIRKATTVNRLLAWLDFREEWREYYCFNGRQHYLIPYRARELAESDGCPHCGEELTWTEHLANSDDYAL